MSAYLSMLALVYLSLFAPPSGSPPGQAERDETAAASTDSDRDEQAYRRVIQLLAQGITAGDENPERAVALLEMALAKLAEFAPQLAADPDALALRASAHVSLARAHLLAGRDAAAAAAIDEGIRSALGRPLPAELYGPAVTQLWRERAAYAQAHLGQALVVKCTTACWVYINERKVGPADLRGLTAGTYRLWIEATDGSREIMRSELELREADEPLTIRYPTPHNTRVVARRATKPTKAPPTTAELNQRDRDSMKRGVILLGVGGGLLAVGIGGGVGLGLGLHDPAPGGMVGVPLGIGGVVCLITGGASYAKAKRRLAQRGGTGGLRVIPTFAASAQGASFGALLEF